MTERERIAQYLHQRIANAFNADEIAHAQGLNGLLGVLEGMTDEEYEQLPGDVVSA